MDIQQIVDLISKHGLKSGIVMVVLSLILAALKSKWFGDNLSKIMDKLVDWIIKKKSGKSTSTNIKPITESDIINHDIFNYIDFWMYSKIPTIQFSTEYRTVAFRRYLTIYLKKYKENLQSYISKGEYKTMDDSAIWKSLLAIINQIVFDYETEMRNSGLPDIIITKMKVKNNDTITLIIDLIEGICNSQFYESENNYLKIYSILNITLSILENTISNSETICNSINGELAGQEIISKDGKLVKEPGKKH